MCSTPPTSKPPDIAGVRQKALTCFCILVAGISGEGKSSFTNALCSCFYGSPVAPNRAGTGNEAETGTKRCMPIPLHLYI